MIPLPAALAPYSAILDLFAPEVAADLARWIPKLALALGPMRRVQPAGGGDPDGFSGIVRRGSYERLLLSEWLLADEAPDEFLRRAAMGDHAFHAIVRRSPAQSATSVAVFDAGPDQLGSPRVVQIAALIVLATRAERASARFVWGILQEPRGALIEGVTKASVQHLIEARTALVARSEDVTEWAERSTGFTDGWLVGAPAGGGIREGWRLGHVAIRDVLDPARRAVAIGVTTTGASTREVEFDLPEDRACTRILRDPFALAVAAPRRTGRCVPVSNLLFAANGSKIFARGPNGSILAYPVPNSPRAPPRRVKRYQSRHPGVIVAVGWIRRSVVLLSVSDSGLVIESVGPRRGIPDVPLLRAAWAPEHPDLALTVPASAGPISLLAGLGDGGARMWLFQDARRTVFTISASDSPGAEPLRLAPFARDVNAFEASNGRVQMVGRLVFQGNNVQRSWLDLTLRGRFGLFTFDGATAMPKEVELPGSEGFDAFFGWQHACVVQERKSPGWVVVPRVPRLQELLNPKGTEVVGVHVPPQGSPELLVLEEDRRSLAGVGRSSSHAWPRASAPIAHVAGCTTHPVFAYATTEGEVVIHSLDRPEPLARFVPSAP